MLDITLVQCSKWQLHQFWPKSLSLMASTLSLFLSWNVFIIIKFALQCFLYTLLRFSCYCLNKTTIILCPSRSPPLQQTKVDMACVWGCLSLNHRGERPLGRCSGEQDFTMEVIWSLSGMRLNERVGFTNEAVLLQKRHVALLAFNGWYWFLPISFFLSGLSR